MASAPRPDRPGRAARARRSARRRRSRAAARPAGSARIRARCRWRGRSAVSTVAWSRSARRPRPESTVCWPRLNSVNGRALQKNAATTMWPQIAAAAGQPPAGAEARHQQRDRAEHAAAEGDLHRGQRVERQLDPEEGRSPQQGEHGHPRQVPALPCAVHLPLLTRPSHGDRCPDQPGRTSEKFCTSVKLCYMLDVRRMQVLRAVVSSGSVTAAAAHLGYTPSAVSQQVAALEKEAGIALLERVGRGVRPTAAGRLLTGHAAVIGQQRRGGRDRTGRSAGRPDGPAGGALLRLGRARPCWRPPWPGSGGAHPGVTVDLKLTDPETPARRGAGRRRPDHRGPPPGATSRRPGVGVVRLLDDAYQAVLPAGHRLADQRVLDLADLAGEPWVGSEPPGPCLDADHRRLRRGRLHPGLRGRSRRTTRRPRASWPPASASP